MILLEYQSIKTFFQKSMVHTGLKNLWWFKKVLKTLCLGQMLLGILKANKLLECFAKPVLEKANQTEFRDEKVIKRKGNKVCIIWKGYDSYFNSWIDKKDIR